MGVVIEVTVDIDINIDDVFQVKSTNGLSCYLSTNGFSLYRFSDEPLYLTR